MVALVGAGGKKTTMYALAAAHPGRVLLSATSHMYPYRANQVDRVISLPAQSTPLPVLGEERVVAACGASATAKRVGGLSTEKIKALIDAYDVDLCILKADGARARWIKSPGAHEPLIPSFATTVVAVVSVQVVGRPLDDRIAHRPERLTNLLGIEAGSAITGEHVADLLSHPHGGLKGVGQAQAIALINMVDDANAQVEATRIARIVLDKTDRYRRIVLASMREGVIVDIIESP